MKNSGRVVVGGFHDSPRNWVILCGGVRHCILNLNWAADLELLDFPGWTPPFVYFDFPGGRPLPGAALLGAWNRSVTGTIKMLAMRAKDRNVRFS